MARLTAMKNRRNYYRLLCVQPDAPLAVIRSSYAALMLKLKQHPDLGGDHETAALLNEAYAVLSHPARRADYDRALRTVQSKTTLGRGPLERQAREGRAARSADSSTPDLGAAASRHTSDVCCPFCHAAHPGPPLAGERCAHCGSPLLSPMHVTGSGKDQRALPRFAHGGDISLVTQQTSKHSRATIQDLSPLGMCVLAAEPLPVDQIVKVDGTLVSAVARVVSCRREGASGVGRAAIGLEFLTLDFPEPRGTFVSRRT